MVRDSPALGSRSPGSSDAMTPGQDIPPRGPAAEGLRQRCAERGLRQEGAEGAANGTSAPRRDGVVRLPAATPASTGRGRKEAAHTADSPPAQRPGCACQSCRGVSGNLARPAPSASDMHATLARCHQISFTRVVDLTLPPHKQLPDLCSPQTTQPGKMACTKSRSLCSLCILKKKKKPAPMPLFHILLYSCIQEQKKNLIRLSCFCFTLGIQESK